MLTRNENSKIYSAQSQNYFGDCEVPWKTEETKISSNNQKIITMGDKEQKFKLKVIYVPKADSRINGTDAIHINGIKDFKKYFRTYLEQNPCGT